MLQPPIQEKDNLAIREPRGQRMNTADYEPELWTHGPVSADVEFDIRRILASWSWQIQRVDWVPRESMFLKHAVPIGRPLSQKHVICNQTTFGSLQMIQLNVEIFGFRSEPSVDE